MIYKDMFKFALSSLSSFIVDYLVYAFFLFVMMAVPISLRILLANGIARVTSSIFNYSTNKHLVFKNKDSVARTGSGYLGLAIGLFILDTLLIRLFYTSFGLHLLLSKVIVGLLLFVVSWLIQKKIIFKERTAPTHEILLKKSYTYAACFGILLTSSFSYSMLKTFVLSDAIQTVKATTTDTKSAEEAAASATTTDTSYSDNNIQVSLTETTVENTQVYIADITVSSSDYLKLLLRKIPMGPM